MNGCVGFRLLPNEDVPGIVRQAQPRDRAILPPYPSLHGRRSAIPTGGFDDTIMVINRRDSMARRGKMGQTRGCPAASNNGMPVCPIRISLIIAKRESNRWDALMAPMTVC